MKVHRNTLAAIAVWMVFLVYFLVRDRDAFLLSLVLTPVLASFAWLAIKSRHVVLSIFMTLALVSHAVAPPFFFLQRQFYTYGGSFGAVKDFNFGVAELLRIYLYVLTFLAFTLVLSIALRLRTRGRIPAAEADRSAVPVVFRRTAGSRRYELLLAGFVLLVAIPCNLFMYSHRIGITGIVPPVLPYRMTGLLYYSRMLVMPLILMALYRQTRRSRTVVALIIGYGFMAGFASSSRFIVSTAIGPVALFALFERRFVQLAGVAVAGSLVFLLVTGSRDYVYSGNLSYVELVETTIRNYDVSQIAPFEMVGGIANRLWGPQDVVLAYQYHVGDRLAAIVNYFAGRVVVNDLTYEFYGMTFSEETGSAGFGVGIGYVPWMIVLADRSVPVLIVLAFITACILNVSEWVVSLYLRRSDVWSAAAYPTAFVLVYCVYTSSLNWWSEMVLLACAPILVLRTLERAGFRRAGPHLAGVE